MKKIPFDKKFRNEIEAGQYHVETKDKKPVEIVKWNSNGLAPIIAIVTLDKKRGEEPVWYDNDGHCYSCGFEDYDLVIVTDEKEAMEEMYSAIDKLISYVQNTEFYCKESLKKEYSKILINLAIKKANEDLMQFENADDYFYEWLAYGAPEMKTYRMCFEEGRRYERINNAKTPD